MTEPAVSALADLPAGPLDRTRWTSIIAAAGRGSRLKFDRPKILYPVGNRPILDWLIDVLDEVCDQHVLVLSPAGRADVEPVARDRLVDRVQCVVQTRPTGMADAVRIGADAARTDYVLVIWGDQVTVRAETLRACAVAHQGRTGAALTFPTIMKADPYVDIERDPCDRILRVRQRREGEIERNIGENDCGVFLFTTAVLREVLAQADDRILGRSTGEANLLQAIPAFERGPGSVMSVRIEDPHETLGINTADDAAAAARVIAMRAHSHNV
jgi:bifunctional UDP-N-acetylglucosamine pyrophosphorylase / glucosamine-1-phosphate N-acetyltransferase